MYQRQRRDQLRSEAAETDDSILSTDWGPAVIGVVTGVVWFWAVVVRLGRAIS